MGADPGAGNVAPMMTGGVAYIEIQRARSHNAIDIDTAHAFLDRRREIDGNERVRAVVLSGQGVSFGDRRAESTTQRSR